jgi:type I restriction enzyme S subunit
MTLETFFEKFDQFADAPRAVGKMRELVLELAVRGRLFSCEKLVSPAPSDPFPIPHDWKWIALSKAADCRASTKVDSASLNDSDWVLDLEDIDGGAGKVIATATFAERSSLSTKASFQKGDVLYGKLRPYLNKVVIADRSGVCSTEIIPLRPQAFVEAGYLRLFLRSPYFLRYAAAKNYGMKMPRLGTKDLESAQIPLPPLAEQKRIVAKVDDLMALCDRLEALQLEREAQAGQLARASLTRFADAPTPANLNLLFHSSFPISPSDLRKSILTLAVQGKLVPQDPNDEPAEDLLGRNDVCRRETARSDHRADEENQPLLSGDDRWDIAETWSWRGLADIVMFVDYRGKTPAKLSSGVRLLTAKNVRKGQINLSPEEFLSECEYHAWMTRGFPKVGDILFTTEAPMGNAAVVELTERFALAQRVICFQSYGAIDPAFLVLQILSDQFQLILDKNGTGVTAKGIKASKLKQLPIAIPPLAEQRRIVAKASELMALVDELETQLAASRAAAEKLLSALVAELTVTTSRLPADS